MSCQELFASVAKRLAGLVPEFGYFGGQGAWSGHLGLT
jgi:hypothetical protein